MQILRPAFSRLGWAPGEPPPTPEERRGYTHKFEPGTDENPVCCRRAHYYCYEKETGKFIPGDALGYPEDLQELLEVLSWAANYRYRVVDPNGICIATAEGELREHVRPQERHLIDKLGAPLYSGSDTSIAIGAREKTLIVNPTTDAAIDAFYALLSEERVRTYNSSRAKVPPPHQHANHPRTHPPQTLPMAE